MSSKIQREKTSSLFWKCIFTSVAVHAFILLLLLKQPIWLSSLWNRFLPKTSSHAVNLSVSFDQIPLDTTFDLFFTKKPSSKPFDLPKDYLDPLPPQGEYVSSSLTWSDPCLELKSPEWLCAHLTPVTNEESLPTVEMAILSTPFSDMPEGMLQEEIPLLLTATHIPVQEEKMDFPSSLTAIPTHQEDIPTLEILFCAAEDAFDSHPLPLSTSPQSLPHIDPETKPLVLPSIALVLPSATETPCASPLSQLKGETSTYEKETPLFTAAPQSEDLLALDTSPSSSFPAPPSDFSSSRPLSDPKLSSSITPAESNPNTYFPNVVAKASPTVAPSYSFGLPRFATVAEWHDLFAIDIRVMPRKEEEDLLFSVVLTPKKEALSHTFRQNYHFIVDGLSSSSHRLPIYKRAIERALCQLDASQHFNIYILGKQDTRFQETPVPCNERNHAKARDFLEKDKYSGKTAKKELNALLRHIVQLPKKQDEFHTIILLADGHILTGKEKKSRALYSWLRYQHDIPIYAATIEDESRPLDLQLLASTSGGKVLISQTHAAFARKFAKMVMDLKYPLATEVAIDIRSKNPQAEVALSSRVVYPCLFANQSYTFVGRADSAEDFTLLLEGRAKDRLIEINKHLSLKNALPTESSLTPLWLETKAHAELAQFLEKGENSLKLVTDLFDQAERKTHRR